MNLPGQSHLPTEQDAQSIKPEKKPDLEIRGLKKSFGPKPVLRGVDLALSSGERLALLGANGAGKTTLLRILAGLTKPDGGSIRIKGLDGIRDAQQVRSIVGFVAHQPYLYDELTAQENLLFFGHMYSVKNLSDLVLELLQRVGLEKRAHERVSALSRGQVQRLAIARALLHTPWLLLLDEPHTSLDEEGNALLETLLAEHVEQEGAVLFTTHDLERARRLGDYIVRLDGGRVVRHHPK